jgi:hypothetical protein
MSFMSLVSYHSVVHKHIDNIYKILQFVLHIYMLCTKLPISPAGYALSY